jgi:hypothetical protein
MSHPMLESQASRPTAPPEPQKEQRRHPRFQLAVRCWITDGRHTLYLRVHDISRGGLSVRAPGPFAPSRKIEVGLELPGGRRVRARGEIVWVRPPTAGESGPRMGARFLEFVEGEEELYQLLGNT